MRCLSARFVCPSERFIAMLTLRHGPVPGRVGCPTVLTLSSWLIQRCHRTVPMQGLCTRIVQQHNRYSHMYTMFTWNSTSSEWTDSMSSMRTRLCCGSTRTSRLSSLLYRLINQRWRQRFHRVYPMPRRLCTRRCWFPVMCPLFARYVHQQPGSVIMWCLYGRFKPARFRRHSMRHMLSGPVPVSTRCFNMRVMSPRKSISGTRTVRLYSLPGRTVCQCYRPDSLRLVPSWLRTALVRTISM